MNYFLAISSNLRLKPKLMRVATIFVLSVPAGAPNGMVRRLFASSEAVGKGSRHGFTRPRTWHHEERVVLCYISPFASPARNLVPLIGMSVVPGTTRSQDLPGNGLLWKLLPPEFTD